MILYTNDGKVYTQYDGTTRWLPGTSIPKNEKIHTSISTLLHSINPNVIVSSIQPICFIDNTFCHKMTAHTLHGLVYCAKIENKEVLEKSSWWWLFYLSDEYIEGIQKYGNKDVLQYFYSQYYNKLIKQPAEESILEEIDTQAKHKRRYEVYRKRWKPIMKALGINRNGEIKKRIIEQCAWAQSVIDVSCWDDTLCNQIASQIDGIVVANDIIRAQTHWIQGEYENLLYTNHAIEKMPFRKDAFDIAVCKNTLHHMQNRQQLIEAVEKIKYIAKKIIIVEIEKPDQTWGIAHILHKKLYRGFLHDVGGAFFDNNQFTLLVEHCFACTHKIEYTTFTTPQWKYHSAIITKL